jgi:hypothetical protein
LPISFYRYGLSFFIDHTNADFLRGDYYNEEQDYYVCPMGQHMNRIGSKRNKTESGYISESVRYRAQRCRGCPCQGSCFKAQGNGIIEVSHRLNEYKRKTRERLTCEEGIKHRGRRCIEAEAVFGQMKYNMTYRRFRHTSKDKVTMDFALFAIAFNIKKLYAKLKNKGSATILTVISGTKRRLYACYCCPKHQYYNFNGKIAA